MSRPVTSDDENKVIVDLSAGAGTPLGVQRVTAKRPIVPDVAVDTPPRNTSWVVILVVAYVVAAAALGLAIYGRFFA